MTPVEALQETLAAEHAAVYLAGVLGAQTSKSEQPALYAALLACYRTHRRRRDQLVTLVAAPGRHPGRLGDRLRAAGPAHECRGQERCGAPAGAPHRGDLRPTHREHHGR